MSRRVKVSDRKCQKQRSLGLPSTFQNACPIGTSAGNYGCGDLSIYLHHILYKPIALFPEPKFMSTFFFAAFSRVAWCRLWIHSHKCVACRVERHALTAATICQFEVPSLFQGLFPECIRFSYYFDVLTIIQFSLFFYIYTLLCRTPRVVLHALGNRPALFTATAAVLAFFY